MNIKRFFTLLTVSLALLFCSVTSCDKSNNTNVDFTIDLTQPQFSQLNNIGGLVVYNNILIARNGAGNYFAVSAYCTFDNSQLSYNVSTDRVYCPHCQSEFNEQGVVQPGYSATVSLIPYSVTQTNNFLRIYSN